MIVSSATYIVVLLLIAAFIVAKPLYARFIKKQDNKYDAMYFLLLILLPINWFTPAIITVTECGKYQKEITLIPTTKEGVKLSYGKHLYVFNNSKSTVIVEDIPFGNVDESDVSPLITIETGKNAAVKGNVVIDYIFEEVPRSVKTKSDGEVKTALYCP
jgi:predicted membrane channel-forming protein YqfA (hemolysin III family)